MSYRIVFTRDARKDISDAARWYKRQRKELGDEFLEEVQATFDRASLNPFGFQCVMHNPEVRRVLTDRFPYRVFFTLRSTEIVIFRVLHTSRHDREWKSRVPSAHD